MGRQAYGLVDGEQLAVTIYEARKYHVSSDLVVYAGGNEMEYSTPDGRKARMTLQKGAQRLRLFWLTGPGYRPVHGMANKAQVRKIIRDFILHGELP